MICTCSHGYGMHDIAKDGSRSSCSHYGCPCAAFTAADVTPVAQLAADLGLSASRGYELLRRMHADPNLEARLHEALTAMETT